KPYGMGPNKLAAELQISLEKANELFKTYARLFPNLDKWLTKQGNFAKVNGYAKTFPPCKRRRYFPDILEAKALRKKALSGQKQLWKQILTIEGNTEREGMNTPIQGTGADIMKEALIATREI